VRAVVGLGNPGRRYRKTRHNIGFGVIEALAERNGAAIIDGPGEYRIAMAEVEREPVALVQPVTFMNNSGVAVQEIVGRFSLSPSDLLIVLDDFSIPLGSLRLRLKGSDGGHNGLASILWHLQTEEVPRLRCGIASATMPHGQEGMADFVLSPFAPEEQARAKDLIALASDAVMAALTGGFETAMNRFNKTEELF
jgi:peptidyl-tRNA hydrolase, PTH1 family